MTITISPFDICLTAEEYDNPQQQGLYDIIDPKADTFKNPAYIVVRNFTQIEEGVTCVVQMEENIIGVASTYKSGQKLGVSDVAFIKPELVTDDSDMFVDKYMIEAYKQKEALEEYMKTNVFKLENV